MCTHLVKDSPGWKLAICCESGRTADGWGRRCRMGWMQEHAGAFSNATGRALEQGGADQPRYRRYQRELISPYCGRSVLEVGAGLGEFAAELTGLDRLVVTDADPGAV